MSNNSLYEITQLLYDILDRVTRLENELLGKNTDLDGGVPINSVENVNRITPKLRLITDDEE